jgi:hypothetical protein
MARGIPWPHFYAGSLVVSAVNLCFLTFAFRPTRAEFKRERQAALELANSLTNRDSPAIDTKLESPSTVEQTTLSIDLVDAPPPKNSEFIHVVAFIFLTLLVALQRAFSMPYLWALSMFSWIQSGRFVRLPNTSDKVHLTFCIKRNHDTGLCECAFTRVRWSV